MEIRWLEDFMALARTRHFSRAAELQHVSQPTFSRRIKLLEEAMGTTLINRQTLPLSLTPAGEMFLELCERVTRDVRDTRERIAALEAEASARISVGSTQGLFSHFYQGWARRAGIAERLQLNLKATNWIGEQFLDALEAGECELVLCYWHRDLPWGERLTPERFDWLVLAQENLVPVSVATDQGAPRFPLPGSPEQPVPLIAYHSRGFLQSAIEAHLARLNQAVNLLPLNENTQSASIKALVKQGFGMGWLPQRMTERSEQFGRLVRAGDERWDVPLEIRLIRLREARSDDLLTLWKQLESQHA
ncbi:LysR family transcriptional regulator [Marinobacter lutaoensis]|jgi:DNA-binding transcriptional LysR family regulator|uniref:LysR family transcriptional regulator n=1 Tax=Marinobacter lutaoensis TaxID=135739 RepID=UPI000C645E7E|nr:LysR family transcriptional regulator [Marinobacter lutaoensis]MBI43394.1 LysR family transcriptional regulator [Oceanospirillales bacterium]MBI44340.1 LysR family transcriptional regulator [Oceanospirillales bacterium]NVD36633.1 LysR family transcriptional regulator [Marinobacter lutaoensis]|tara:strand:- start:384 stop:1298 length:915 start_codon:yes stop_codon:yes gene_type:complete